IHCDRLAGRGEKALWKEFRQPAAQEGMQAEERGTHSHFAQSFGQLMHRLPGEVWGRPGRVTQQQPRISVRPDDVVHRLPVRRVREQALTAAQQIGDEQLLISSPGKKCPGVSLVTPAIPAHMLGKVVEIVTESAQSFAPPRIVDFQMHDVHHYPSDQTVGNTSGSLKSGSPLDSLRHSCSSNMWISLPSALR